MHGLFLSSRVARRTFWTLLAAALLPLILFAALGWQALAEREQAQQRRAETEHLKYVGLRVYDRLATARAVLAAHAAESGEDRPTPRDPAVRSLISSVAHVHDGGRIEGDVTLLAGWAPAAGRSLWWQAPAPGDPPRVIVAQRGPQPGSWWLAEVAPDFLWQDFAADGAADGICVRDADGLALHCAAAPVAGRQAAWRLFMHAGFGSPDWTFEGRPPVAGPGEWPVGRMLALGSVATLLLIAMLALVTVRRTMVPLERLTEGTRRLAAGDWSARVGLPSGDEFGQLAESFDRMAARIGHQVQALEVQAAIDRDMLQGRGLAPALARVAARLEALFPGARARVLACSPADGRWHLFGTRDTPPVPLADAGALAPLRAGVPAEVTRALGWPQTPGAVLSVPVPCGEDGDAALLLAAPGPLEPAGPAQRELGVLRDRVAVTLTAARRDHRLRQRAAHDELTGLLNRHGLNDACDALLPGPLSLLYLDLDGFKEVNDAYGHSFGDELLRAVAQRLADGLPEGALLARPGGDEFVLVLPGPAEAGERLAAQVCLLLAQPFVLRGQPVHVGVSVGLAQAPEDGSDRETLQRRADLAMYAAKAQGRGRWRRFDPALDREASERAWLLRDLRTALDARGLALHYQPRLDLAGGGVPSVEALVRWRHPQQGWIPPVRFVPVAEESDLIFALGDFVLDEALAQQARWRRAGVPVGRVAVNVSARQLRQADFAAWVLAGLDRHGLRPQDLELELTESLFAGESQAVVRALEPLRRLGVIVALDDFGTGYSSLSALQQLPVDVLKIDRSFVTGLGEQPGAEAIVRSIVALARALGKRVVAEGVETERQEALLLQLGCDEYQGYRYARPMPGEALPAHLAASAPALAEA